MKPNFLKLCPIFEFYLLIIFLIVYKKSYLKLVLVLQEHVPVYRGWPRPRNRVWGHSDIHRGSPEHHFSVFWFLVSIYASHYIMYWDLRLCNIQETHLLRYKTILVQNHKPKNLKKKKVVLFYELRCRVSKNTSDSVKFYVLYLNPISNTLKFTISKVDLKVDIKYFVRIKCIIKCRIMLVAWASNK